MESDAFGLFLDFLAGNREYHCTPWGMPTRNVFGWQKPCYLLGEGYAKTYKELMETTDWDSYGTGRYEKCANCMAHCGYEPTAAHASISNPLSALWTALRGVRTTGPMAPEISLDAAAAGAVRLLASRREDAARDPRGHARGGRRCARREAGRAARCRQRPNRVRRFYSAPVLPASARCAAALVPIKLRPGDRIKPTPC